MADYYPLITKAIASLGLDATAQRRRTVYERARTALLAQLRTANPPFDEAKITRERLALEEAVRRVEDGAKQRAHDDCVTKFSALVTDADELSRVPSMIVNGDVTGRLTPIWRWRSRVRRRPNTLGL